MILKVLENLDAVVDVGGVYDPSRDRYDHHQRGFEKVFGHGFTTKLSSAGLVYKVPPPPPQSLLFLRIMYFTSLLTVYLLQVFLKWKSMRFSCYLQSDAFFSALELWCRDNCKGA